MQEEKEEKEKEKEKKNARLDSVGKVQILWEERGSVVCETRKVGNDSDANMVV